MPADDLNAYEFQACDASFFKTALRNAEPLVSSEESERTSAVCTSGPITGPGTRPGTGFAAVIWMDHRLPAAA